MPNVQLVTLAPAHFHAALVQKQALPGVDSHCHVYAPLDADLIDHLGHLARFNSRPNNPTAWKADVHAGPGWLDRFLVERPGNAVVIAGRNKPKIDLILAAVAAGYCVLADKPWIVDAADFPKLERVFSECDRSGVFAWDIMTERFEATNQLLRELVNNPEVFGDPVVGTRDTPAVEIESVHYLVKDVAGIPLRRPAWWFNPATAGEAMADVGTHLADLALWLTFPDEPIDHRADIEVLSAIRSPTRIEVDDFRQITGLTDVPGELSHLKVGDGLTYWGNGSTTIRIRDRIVRLTTRWGVRADGPDGDSHLAVARGTRSMVVAQHDRAFGPGPHVFVMPTAGRKARVLAACKVVHPAIDLGDRIHLPVPPAARTGHESHFAAVLNQVVSHFHNRAGIPGWERPNLLTKYEITTTAVEMARSSGAG